MNSSDKAKELWSVLGAMGDPSQESNKSVADNQNLYKKYLKKVEPENKDGYYTIEEWQKAERERLEEEARKARERAEAKIREQTEANRYRMKVVLDQYITLFGNVLPSVVQNASVKVDAEILQLGGKRKIVFEE